MGALLAKNLGIGCGGGPGRVEGLASLLDARSALMLVQPPWGPCHPGTSLLQGGASDLTTGRDLAECLVQTPEVQGTRPQDTAYGS